MSPVSRSLTLIGVVLVAMALFAIACLVRARSSRPLASRPAPPAGLRVAYGSSPSELGELRLPAGAGPHPVAIVLHGGCWRSQYDLSYMAPLAAALTEAGIATWNVEYRRLGEKGGGWPGTFVDAARAADHVRRLAERHPLDLERVIVVGHSAGGQLALWLAGRHRLPEQSPLHAPHPLALRGVVSLAGITDLRRTGTACDADVAPLMGGGVKERAPLYDQVSPIALVPSGVRSTIVHGARDRIVPPAMATDYVAAAVARGDDARVVMIEGAGHFDVVDPTSPAWPAVLDAVRALLADGPRATSR